MDELQTTTFIVIGEIVLQFIVVGRALLRPHREPESRAAWVILILALPAIGIVLYILFGDTNIGKRRARRYRRVARLRRDREVATLPEAALAEIADCNHHLFQSGHSISHFAPVGGNSAEILPDSDAMIDRLVADIDAAQETVHLLFYIWLADRCGVKIIEAVKRAAARGVTVRVMADDMGSRKLTRSRHWQEMIAAGVIAVRALPVRFIPLHLLTARVDLRNHRKIIVIDDAITYCGSQNCAAPEFLVKRKYAPWVDLMVRFEGPIARQNQWLFLQDWLAHHDEDLSDLFEAPPVEAGHGGVVCQAFGTGPTVRFSAMPEMFEVLIHAARDELVITTPYYVPTDSIQSALCAAGHRGVKTTLVFPKRNDSRIVAAASRSYYRELLEAGVRIFEYPGGLLHAKSLTLDGQIALIGSANIDRRSFDLNYENNVLLQDHALTAGLRARQDVYIGASEEVQLADVTQWGMGRRLWINTIAMFGPVM